MQSEPIDMPFYGHHTQGENRTPASVGFNFANRQNRNPSAGGSQGSDGSDNNDNNDNDEDDDEHEDNISVSY